jgi:Fusaric acid resistance protein-like
MSREAGCDDLVVVPMRFPDFRRRQPRRIGAAARAVAERTPGTLSLVRHRAQPTAVTVARLAATAVFAYLVALPFPVTPRPVLAPLTALLVAQVTLYQTLFSAVRRVGAVLAGVLLAVGLSALVGFTWWSLGLTVGIALTIGYALHLGDAVLEVPISAMLILSVTGVRAAASGRIIETFIGAAAGLLAGIVLAPPRVQPAAEAIEDLCRKMADLLDQIAASLRDGSVLDQTDELVRRARSLAGEIGRADEELRRAEDSVRLNPGIPRSLRQLPSAAVSLRDRLETLEHGVIIIRVFARSLADTIRLGGDHSPLLDPEARGRLADALGRLAAAVRVYGRLAVVTDTSSYERLVAELSRYLQEAEEQQDRLSELLRADPATRPVGWPLRGELLSHLDRLRSELQAGSPAAALRIRRERSWRRPLQAGRRQRRSPTRRRPKALSTVRGGPGWPFAGMDKLIRFMKGLTKPMPMAGHRARTARSST